MSTLLKIRKGILGLFELIFNLKTCYHYTKFFDDGSIDLLNFNIGVSDRKA